MTRADSAILAVLAGAGFLLALAIPEPHAESAPIVGNAVVVDGDTIRIVGGPRIRLEGIDAPEAAQTCLDGEARPYACGKAATDHLRQMLGRDPRVTCVPKQADKYGRILATCRTADGDVGARMVAAGWAIDYAQYSKGMYKDEQATAKSEKLGIWAGAFDAPWNWRKQHAPPHRP